MKVRNLLVVTALVSLIGCVATPKPELADDGYKQFAGWFSGAHRCAVKGYADVGLVAFANNHLKYQLAAYTYDVDKLKDAIAQTDAATPSDVPTQEDCNAMALRIAEIKQQRDINLANSAAQEQSEQQTLQILRDGTPKTAYCNKYGAQTICNTY